MKVVKIIDCPVPYEKTSFVIVEDSFTDRKTGNVIPFVKSLKCPAAGSANIKVGDEVLPLYDQWQKLVSFSKVN